MRSTVLERPLAGRVGERVDAAAGLAGLAMAWWRGWVSYVAAVMPRGWK